jgi:hypothetical protein
MLLAAGGLILVQRSVPIAMRRQHNDGGRLYLRGARRSLRRAPRARGSSGVGAMERSRR